MEKKNEENKKIKMGQHAKGRSQKLIGSRHVDSVRVGSDRVIFVRKGMKVRARGASAYISTYGTTDAREMSPGTQRLEQLKMKLRLPQSVEELKMKMAASEQARGITVLMREQ